MPAPGTGSRTIVQTSTSRNARQCPARRFVAAAGPSGKWQATSCPAAPCGCNGGSSWAQMSWASGHLVRNLQPDGGSVAAGGGGRHSPAGPCRAWPGLPAADRHGWYRRDQPRGVRMPRRSADVLSGPDLDQLAEVHHADRVGHVPDDRQIMRDEQVAQSVLPLQLAHQVEDLRLHRHVQCGHGLVRHDQGRAQDQRPGQRQPLPLAAGELPRIPAGGIGRQAYLVQDPGYLPPVPRRRTVFWIASGSRRIDATRIRGSSEANESWNISWMPDRCARS